MGGIAILGLDLLSWNLVANAVRFTGHQKTHPVRLSQAQWTQLVVGRLVVANYYFVRALPFFLSSIRFLAHLLALSLSDPNMVCRRDPGHHKIQHK